MSVQDEVVSVGECIAGNAEPWTYLHAQRSGSHVWVVIEPPASFCRVGGIGDSNASKRACIKEGTEEREFPRGFQIKEVPQVIQLALSCDRGITVRFAGRMQEDHHIRPSCPDH